MAVNTPSYRKSTQLVNPIVDEARGSLIAGAVLTRRRERRLRQNAVISLLSD
jgi:hypothetical protein